MGFLWHLAPLLLVVCWMISEENRFCIFLLNYAVSQELPDFFGFPLYLST